MKVQTLMLIFMVFLAACQDTMVPGESYLSGDLTFKTQNQKFSIIEGELVTQSDPMSSHIVGVYENKEGQVCAGTLLKNNQVLTAAHCVGAEMYLIFDQKFSENSLVRAVSQREIYPAYHVGKDDLIDTYDLALLKFEGDLPEGYAPAQLISLELWQNYLKEIQEAPLKITVAGFGFNQLESKSGIGELRKTELIIEDWNQNLFSAIADQKKGGAVCAGDSGGPAFIYIHGRPYLWAVTAHALSVDESTDKAGKDASPCRYKSVFTQVLPFSEWIRGLLLPMSLVRTVTHVLDSAVISAQGAGISRSLTPQSPSPQRK
ncbi:MAG TPA: trypsin-like serine protease [Pseudobdellovibrionaceae bacterium]|nr:trypsin-like serine protease [Pseudobdellovibrionaceae bacterium]